jgi:hypothetical protein
VDLVVQEGLVGLEASEAKHHLVDLDSLVVQMALVGLEDLVGLVHLVGQMAQVGH